MHAVIDEQKNHRYPLPGINESVTRMSGGDHIHSGTVVGKLEGERDITLGFVDLLRDDFVEQDRSRSIYFTQDWVSLPGVLPVASGGAVANRVALEACVSSYEGRDLARGGSGYDRFDRKEGIVCIFRWGFPSKNRRIFLRFLIKDIQSGRIEVKEARGIEVPQAVLPDTVFEAVVRIPYDMQLKQAGTGKGQIYPDGSKSNNTVYNATAAGIVSKSYEKEKGGYEITITDASERQVVDITPPGPELLVSEGESNKFDQPLTSNPNVGDLVREMQK
ncbi:hypothetical protein HAX54_026896 [Datura stramonium]|uniref:Cytochrome f n=1 Tax=Datura stramonium TaxID=4076 RepID=A0ABS8V3Y3_DATST|nr:hypothetical protein [Datura stramonium]